MSEWKTCWEDPWDRGCVHTGLDWEEEQMDREMHRQLTTQTRDVVGGAVEAPEAVIQSRCALDMSPRHKFEMMSLIAEEAARAIKAAGFTTRIQNRDYVQVEGWSMIGLAWGCCARERDVHYEQGLGWVAHVDICRLDTGAVVGGASHIVGDDEATWKSRDTYAKRSMAVTRATGKAFRMMFSATVKMAGYEPTPAEEMPQEDQPTIRKSSSTRSSTRSTKTKKAEPKPPPPNPDSGAIDFDEETNALGGVYAKAKAAIATASDPDQCEAIHLRITGHPELTEGEKKALLDHLKDHEELLFQQNS